MRRPIRQLRLLLIPLIGGLLLAAALHEPSPPPLRIATSVWVGYEPLYLARKLGSWTSAQVRLVECSSATQSLRLFRNGSVDVAALTLDEALTLVEDGVDLRVFLVTDTSHGADAILARAPLRTVAALSGRRVGVEPGAVGAYVLLRACELSGVEPALVEIVPLEIHEQEQAFLAGRVDALVTFEPVRSRLLAHGAREVFNSKQIPGEIVDVLVVRRETLSKRGPALRLVARGWFAALRYLAAEPEAAAARMAPRQGLPPGEVLESLSGLEVPTLAENVELLAGPSPPLNARARRLSEFMLRAKLIGRPITLEALAEPSVLPERRVDR
ncbi:MAG: ABC transporter substrate-binding protein [Planctomycetes bacterium]|nr:ABC transporter substrate-binding protein [Planctomycetota bacterium]